MQIILQIKRLCNTLLKWDFSGAASDKVNFLFDTFSDGNNAYMFGSNMLGVKSDILVSNGGVGTSR